MAKVTKTMRFPEDLVREIKNISAERDENFTEFVQSAIKAYIRGLRFSDAVNESAGAWDLNKHPELKEGSDKYIRKVRKGRKHNGSF